MKVCIPAQDSKGLDGTPYGHFGSASHFVVHDTGTGETEIVGNADAHHAHGMCHPLSVIEGRHIEAIIVGGIGAGAIRKLQAGGVRVYRAAAGTIRENVDLLTSGKLEELSVENACGGRGEDHKCGS